MLKLALQGLARTLVRHPTALGPLTLAAARTARCAAAKRDRRRQVARRARRAGISDEASAGRLLARPGQPSQAGPTGTHQLGLASPCDGVLCVPSSYTPNRPAPLALSLHGAGGNGLAGLSQLLKLADSAGLIILAPDSRGATWDVIRGGYGPDVEYVDLALRHVFDRYAVDPTHLAVSGFSDGASYALSLGLTNGDLFTHVVAFSPGFMSPAAERGQPRIYVSHGTRDAVLPIDRCSRRLVPLLRAMGYDVLYHEYDGPHAVPPEIAEEAVGWLVGD